MELNREQIVKALECCSKKKWSKCSGCPREAEDALCMYRLCSDALALIRELTEENERLEKEVDRLSQVVLYHDGITEMEVAEAKADTVRKMQERLKARYKLPQSNEVSSISPFQLHECIDQIAKELLEEET